MDREDLEVPLDVDPAVEEINNDKSSAELKDVSRSESSAQDEEVPEQKTPIASDDSLKEKSPAEVEEAPEQDSPAVSKVVEPPIVLPDSANIMDLNKLLEENGKYMVSLGKPGCSNSEAVLTFINEAYDQYPEVQMIKYHGPNVNNFIRGQIKEGLEPLKTAQGMYFTPIVCFFEQNNLVKMFAGFPMPIKDSLNALASMPLSVSNK